jgi:hypothetical protein
MQYSILPTTMMVLSHVCLHPLNLFRREKSALEVVLEASSGSVHSGDNFVPFEMCSV